MNLENPDNLPVANRTPGEVHYADRLGICQRCSTPKRPVPMMTIDGKKVCPNCDTKSETRSGLVNTIQDPGEDAFEKVVHKGKDGKEYIEMKPKAPSVFKKLAKGKTIKVNPAPKPNHAEPKNPITSPQGSPISEEAIIQPQTATQLLNRLVAAIESVNVKTMNEFKSRDKIIKALKKIQGQVDNLTGGPNE